MSEKDKKKKTTKQRLQHIKGTRDIVGDEYYQLQGFFEKAQEIATYYGFSPIEPPVLEDAELYKRGVGENTDIVEKEMYTLKTKGGEELAMRPEGTASIMRAYIQHGMHKQPQPVMLYYYGPFFRHEKPQQGRLRELRQFGLEILGSAKSISDAIIIQTTSKILEEVGGKNLVVHINSIGDKESRKEYVKALTKFYRKHINDLAAIDRQRLKTNPLRILDSKENKTMKVNENAPESLEYLNQESKKHFTEVLECLDEAGIQYKINKFLVRGLDYYSNTVFEIMAPEEDGEKPLSVAGGGRFDYLSKTLGYSKQISGIGVGIGVDRLINASWFKPIDPKLFKKPKVFFIQLGFEAKLKSLKVIEKLRKAKIPVTQSLSRDRLSTQLAIAEKTKAPYAIIFGQKESMDGTVIVRNMKTRSQKTVNIDDLEKTIKQLK